jgi:hypothetical protein
MKFGIDAWRALHRRSGYGMVTETREMLGLHRNPGVNFHFGSNHRPSLRDPQMRVGEMSLEAVGIGIFGYENFRRVFGPDRSMRHTMEAGPAGIDPTVFANINTFTGVVAGLVEVTMLERYIQATHIADQLVKIEPSKVIGQRKKIGIGMGGDQAKKRLPSEPHPRARLGEKWVRVPDTEERALAIDLPREAVFSDLTNDLVEAAGAIGEWVGFRRAMVIYDVFLGITNPFYFNDTNYNTYQTSGTATANNNYTNSIVNPVTDSLTMWTLADAAFADMKEPPPPAGTNTPIVITPDTVVVSPAYHKKMLAVTGGDMIRIGDGASSTVASYAPNPLKGQTLNVISSPQLYQRVTAADGKNLSGAAAQGRWWYFQKDKPFGYSENWPLQVTSAPVDNYNMLDQGLVASFFADERGVPFVIDPRFVLENKNS